MSIAIFCIDLSVVEHTFVYCVCVHPACATPALLLATTVLPCRCARVQDSRHARGPSETEGEAHVREAERALLQGRGRVALRCVALRCVAAEGRRLLASLLSSSLLSSFLSSPPALQSMHDAPCNDWMHHAPSPPPPLAPSLTACLCLPACLPVFASCF